MPKPEHELTDEQIVEKLDWIEHTLLPKAWRDNDVEMMKALNNCFQRLIDEQAQRDMLNGST